MKQSNEIVKNAAEIIRSLGHPARIEILMLLKRKSKTKMTVTQIQEELGLTQPETSRHLAVLKISDVLLCEKEGSSAYYFINEDNALARGIANCVNKLDNNSASEKK